MRIICSIIKEGYYALHGDREYNLDYLGRIEWCIYDKEWQVFFTDTYLSKDEFNTINAILQELEDLPIVEQDNDSSN